MRVPLIIAVAFAAGLLAASAASLVVPAETPPNPWERLEYRETDAQVDCPSDATVIVTIGQSNAANSVGQRFVAQRAVYEMHGGRCYHAQGALAGADLTYGSYWPLVGDMLTSIAHPVFVGMAMGNTTVAQWADPAELGGYLARRLREIQGVKYVLWHQGEADTKTPPERYSANLRRVIAIVHQNAPGAKILVAQASLCSGGRESAALREAQASVVNPQERVFAGPNTDEVRAFDDRYDGCHFSERGARTVARMWTDKIVLAK